MPERKGGGVKHPEGWLGTSGYQTIILRDRQIDAYYEGFNDALSEALKNNPRGAYWTFLLSASLKKIVDAELARAKSKERTDV